MDPIQCYSVREVTIKYRTVRRYVAGKTISKSNDIFALFRAHLAAERVEVFQTLLVDAKNAVMAVETVSRGTLNMSLVHPREVFSTVVRLQAASVCFMHNHPSGDPSPSREDRECTDRLCKAAAILGIRVLDHVVFGSSDYYSFADSGLIRAYDQNSVQVADTLP